MTHTSTEQPEALHFADVLDNFYSGIGRGDATGAAAELRRLHARVQELEASQARVPLSDDDVSLWIVRTLNKASKQGKYEAIRNGVPLSAELVPFFIEFAAAHGITQEKP